MALEMHGNPAVLIRMTSGKKKKEYKVILF